MRMNILQRREEALRMLFRLNVCTREALEIHDTYDRSGWLNASESQRLERVEEEIKETGKRLEGLLGTLVPKLSRKEKRAVLPRAAMPGSSAFGHKRRVQQVHE